MTIRSLVLVAMAGESAAFSSSPTPPPPPQQQNKQNEQTKNPTNFRWWLVKHLKANLCNGVNTGVWLLFFLWVVNKIKKKKLAVKSIQY